MSDRAPDRPAPPDADELARRCAEHLAPLDAVSRDLGIETVHVGPGRATLAMTITPTMTNGHGMAHGGYLFLLADTAFAFACNTYDEVTVAASADIVFVRPAQAGDRLTATAVERVRSGRSGIYDVTVRRGDDGDQPGEVIAEFRGGSRSLGRAILPTDG